MQQRTIFLVRHGETDWNTARRWQGQTDVALNAVGRAQARAVADALRTEPVAGVVASDLSRAHDTARILAESLGVEVAYVDPDLRERSFGCFEGLTREECEERHAEAWKAWLADRQAPAGAEETSQVAARMGSAIARAAGRVARDDAAVVIVTHGGAIRAFVHATTGVLPPPVANGELWRVTWDGEAFAVEGRWDPPSRARVG